MIMRNPKLNLLGAALIGAALFSPAAHADPFDVLRSFNAVIFQNFTSQSSDVEGTLAVGGNTTLFNYSINQSNAAYNGYGLVVGGNLTFTNGTVWNSSQTYYGGTLSGAAVNYTGGTITTPTAGPVDFVVRVVRRKSDFAQLMGDPETTEDFHGARRNLAALDARWSVGRAPLGDDDIDAAPGKIQGERHADRPPAHDQHSGFNRPSHPVHSARLSSSIIRY